MHRTWNRSIRFYTIKSVFFATIETELDEKAGLCHHSILARVRICHSTMTNLELRDFTFLHRFVVHRILYTLPFYRNMLKGTFAAVVVCLAAANAAVFNSLRHDLPFTDDDAPLLSQHVLAFHNCAPTESPLLESPPYGFTSGSLSDEAATDIFGTLGACKAVCLERGVDREIAHAAMPHKIYKGGEYRGTLTDWFESNCRQVEVCLINYYDPKVLIKTLWIQPDTNEAVVHLDDIQYGEPKTRCFNSFIGHKFHVVTSSDDTKITEFQVEYTLVLAVGNNFPPDNRETRDFDKEIRSTLKYEWEKHLQVKRTFSPLGFSKGRLPPDVFASMRSFFNNNKGNKVTEEWGGRGVFVNWYDNAPRKF